jgi:hypothetical protein
MKTSKRTRDRIAREDGCRTARRAVEESRRTRSPLSDPALRRMSPLG